MLAREREDAQALAALFAQSDGGAVERHERAHLLTGEPEDFADGAAGIDGGDDAVDDLDLLGRLLQIIEERAYLFFT